MKAVNNICRYAAIVFGLASLLLFFADFATVITSGGQATAVAAQYAFGSKIAIGETTFDLARSTHLQLCFWLTAASVVSSFLTIKYKKARFAASGLGIATSIYMLVVALSAPEKFIDFRPVTNITDITHTPFVWVLFGVLVGFTALSIAHLLIDDYLEVLASNGEKRTIWQHIVHFFRDYKSEVKKIVWPNYKDVAKNTFIVLIMCLLVGLLIWGVDFGLVKLLDLILGINS